MYYIKSEYINNEIMKKKLKNKYKEILDIIEKKNKEEKKIKDMKEENEKKINEIEKKYKNEINEMKKKVSNNIYNFYVQLISIINLYFIGGKNINIFN